MQTPDTRSDHPTPVLSCPHPPLAVCTRVPQGRMAYVLPLMLLVTAASCGYGYPCYSNGQALAHPRQFTVVGHTIRKGNTTIFKGQAICSGRPSGGMRSFHWSDDPSLSLLGQGPGPSNDAGNPSERSGQTASAFEVLAQAGKQQQEINRRCAAARQRIQTIRDRYVGRSGRYSGADTTEIKRLEAEIQRVTKQVKTGMTERPLDDRLQSIRDHRGPHATRLRLPPGRPHSDGAVTATVAATANVTAVAANTGTATATATGAAAATATAAVSVTASATVTATAAASAPRAGRLLRADEVQRAAVANGSLPPRRPLGAGQAAFNKHVIGLVKGATGREFIKTRGSTKFDPPDQSIRPQPEFAGAVTVQLWDPGTEVAWDAPSAVSVWVWLEGEDQCSGLYRGAAVNHSGRLGSMHNPQEAQMHDVRSRRQTQQGLLQFCDSRVTSDIC